MADPGSARRLRLVVMGGIGAGKSTVGAMFADLGAVVIDADRVGHEVLEPGGDAFDDVAARWPAAVSDGRIDRAALAAIVFSDPDQLAELEAITHPAIGRTIEQRVAKVQDEPVVVELPLMRRMLGEAWTWLLVDAPDEMRVSRAVERGMAREAVLRRIAAQPAREAWLDAADHVIVNDGDLEELRAQVLALWKRLSTS